MKNTAKYILSFSRNCFLRDRFYAARCIRSYMISKQFSHKSFRKISCWMLTSRCLV